MTYLLQTWTEWPVWIIVITKTNDNITYRKITNNSNQEHSESANLLQRQNLKQKWSGIRIRICGLIRIRMSFCPKMLWMHYLVGISHFAKYGTNRPLTVWEMLTNAQKFCSVEENEKVIRNPHADPDHHQKLITSRGSPLGHACQVTVNVRFRIHQLSCLQNARQDDHTTYALLTEVTTVNN